MRGEEPKSFPYSFQILIGIRLWPAIRSFHEAEIFLLVDLYERTGNVVFVRIRKLKVIPVKLLNVDPLFGAAVDRFKHELIVLGSIGARA